MKPCGLLGQRLSHSWSPLLHSLLGSYEYRLWEVAPDEVAAFLQKDSFHGLNVTIPYKETVLPFCRELSPAARSVDSVNTLLRRPDGSLFGDNTDIDGFAFLLRRSGVDVRGKKALILGSGGASRAAAYVLRRANVGALVTISRRGENTYENLERHRDAALIVNATPVGMYPENNAIPLELAVFPALEAVFDLIYNPARTRLLLAAARLGIKAFGGLPMLVGQAAAAAERFTGEEVSPVRWEELHAALSHRTENLILIGMPGSGKTTLGRLAAEKMGRPFLDTDALLEERTGISIPVLLAREGEDGFRKRETALLAEIGKLSGRVIATGGGCVTQPENEVLLRQNGRVVFLRRDIALLPRDGRPLSQRYDLAALYQTRLPLYQAFSDLTVENNGTPQTVADHILEGYNEIFDIERAEHESPRLP